MARVRDAYLVLREYLHGHARTFEVVQNWIEEWGPRARSYEVEGRPDMADAGGLLLDLAAFSDTWISRRSEYVTFEDDRAARVRSVIEVDTAGIHDLLDDGRLPELHDQVMLPVALHRIHPHRNVILRDPDGQPLPFLRKSEERELLAAGLADLSYEYIAQDDGEVELSWWSRFDTFLGALDDWEQAPSDEAADDLLNRMSETWKPFTSQRLLVALLPRERFAGRPSLLRRRYERFRIEEEHTIQANFRPTRWRGRDNFDTKVAQQYWDKSDPTVQIEGDVLQTFRLAPESPWEGAHPDPPWMRQRRIDDATISIDASAQVLAASYHLRIQCPPATYIDDAWLVVTRAEILDLASDEVPRIRAEVLQVEDDDAHWDTAHFQYAEPMSALRSATDDDEDERAVEVTSAVAVLTLRPLYQGALRSGVHLSWITTLVLYALTFSVGWDAAAFRPLVAMEFVERDTNSVVSLIALVPTVAFVVLIRHEEHMLTKFVLHGYRIRLGILAAVSFSASMALAVGLAGKWLFAALLLTSLISTALSAVLWWSGRRSRHGTLSQLRLENKSFAHT